MAIQCPKCKFDNPPDTIYCGKCATPLPHGDKIAGTQTETLRTPLKELARGTIFAGRYEIIEELGKGGMGNIRSEERFKKLMERVKYEWEHFEE